VPELELARVLVFSAGWVMPKLNVWLASFLKPLGFKKQRIYNSRMEIAESGKPEKAADARMREHRKLLERKFKRREELSMAAGKCQKGMGEIKCWQKNCRKKSRIRRSKRFKTG